MTKAQPPGPAKKASKVAKPKTDTVAPQVQDRRRDNRPSKPRITKEFQEKAMQSGLLPHEWLLAVSRGDAIAHRRVVTKTDRNGKVLSKELVEDEVYADFPTRVECARAAAPFYAPKLATQIINVKGGNEAVAAALMQVAAKLPV